MKTKEIEVQKKLEAYDILYAATKEKVNIIAKKMYLLKNETIKFNKRVSDNSTKTYVCWELTLTYKNMSGFTAGILLNKLDELGYLLQTSLIANGIKVSFFEIP